MRDPKKGINCDENELSNAEHHSAISSMDSCSNDIRGAGMRSVDSTLDNAATLTEGRNGGSSKAAHSKRYKEVMEALQKPVSSYTLLYEQHLLAPTSKIPRTRGLPKSTLKPKLVHEIKLKKTLTKKRKAELGSFPKNVRSLLGTGMLDGALVQYISASGKNQLAGKIKGSSYLCGCNSCNFSKAVNADEFETHADCKTCHPNNHIHLDNDKTMHQVVQELKNTDRSMLCSAIMSVLGASLNQEAFFSWKESFGAQECSTQEEIRT